MFSFEYGPPAGYPVQYRLSGSDIPQLKIEAEKLRKIVAAQPQVTAVNLDWNEQSLTMKALLDQDKIKALGLSSEQVGRVLALQLAGVSLTQFRENDLLIDVVLRTPRSEHTDVDALRALPIGVFNGHSVTLGQIARIEPVFEDGVIWRRDRLPAIAVRGDPIGNTQPDTIIAALAPQVDAFKAQLPPGFRLEVGGPVESSAKANAAIGASWPLILITTFTLLMLQLGNFSRALLVVLTAPLGIIGVAIALLVSGQPMGFVALLGIISLAGMIMRNSVILVDQIQQDVARGLSQWDAIIESTVRRMRPITLTAAAAALAMLLAGAVLGLAFGYRRQVVRQVGNLPPGVEHVSNVSRHTTSAAPAGGTTPSGPSFPGGCRCRISPPRPAPLQRPRRSRQSHWRPRRRTRRSAHSPPIPVVSSSN